MAMTQRPYQPFKQYRLFAAGYEVGTCRTSLLSPQKLILSIYVHRHDLQGVLLPPGKPFT